MNDTWHFEIPIGKMKLSSLKAKISSTKGILGISWCAF